MRSTHSRILILALLLACLAVPAPVAQAQAARLRVFVSASRNEAERGDIITFTISAYSEAAEATSATLTLTPAAGLEPIGAPVWNSAEIWQDHPLTIAARYRVASTAPTDGALLSFTVALVSADDAWGSASTQIRIGTFPWPPARFCCVTRYLPLVSY